MLLYFHQFTNRSQHDIPMKQYSFSSLAALAAITLSSLLPTRAAERPLHIICFGAHPDDCELQAGGTAALWASKGHKVKFVSCTNGDIGHWREAGGPLAKRRPMGGEQAAEMLRIVGQVLDIYDGEILPAVEE